MSAPLEESGFDQLKRLGRYVFVRRIVTLCAVIMSALLQAFVIKVFVNPANLLSGGFTGLAILIDRITQLFGVSFSTSLGMIALNVPVALLVWRSISRRFVIFSMLQVFLASAFLQFCPFEPLLDNTILCGCSAACSTESPSRLRSKAEPRPPAPTSSPSWCPTRRAAPSGNTCSWATA